MPGCLKRVCRRLPQRWVTSVLCSGSVTMCFLYRHTFLQALTNLVYNSDVVARFRSNISDCPYMVAMGSSPYMPESGVYLYWSQDEVRAVHQAYVIGLIISLVPVGMIVDNCGHKGALVTGLAMNMVLAVLCPFVIPMGPNSVLGVRLAEGVSQGLVWPSVAVFAAHWAPPSQRATFCSGVAAGQFIGWGLGYYVADLIHHFISNSWTLPFYVAGVIISLWLVSVIVFISSTVDDNPYIAPHEMSFINTNLEGFEEQEDEIKWDIPFKAMLTSPVLLSLILNNLAADWIHHTTFNHVDQFLFHVLHFTSHVSRSSKVAIETLIAVSMVCWGIISDKLVNKKYISRKNNRKVFSFAANILAALCMVGLTIVGCDSYYIISLYMALCYLRGPQSLITLTNVIDLSPRHAGVLIGLIHFVGTIELVFLWELMAFVCQEPCDFTKWRIIVGVTFLVVVVFSLPYLWFGSAEVQSWNYPRSNKIDSTTSSEDSSQVS